MLLDKIFSQNDRLRVLYPLLLVVGVFIWQGMTGLNLRDEGYLWYGAKAMLAGDVTFRDYSGYDPGRYLLSAAAMTVMGDTGILPVRLAAMVCQFVAMVILMHHIVRAGMIRNVRDEWFAVALLCLVCLWMFPRHKIFDNSTSLLLVALLSWLVSAVTHRRALLVGIGIGLVALMGRNHAVYGLVAIGLVLPVVLYHDFSIAKTLRIIGAGLLGIVIGSLPLLFIELAKPGFVGAFVDSVLFLAEIKTTNAALPVPWPWLVPFDGTASQILQRLSVGLWFVAVLLGGWAAYFYAVSVWIRTKQTPALLLASSSLAVVYTHVAFSRADPAHLAQSIAPLLVALVCISWSLRGHVRTGLIAALLVLSLTGIGPLHPGVQCVVSMQCQPVTIGGSTLLVPQSSATEVQFFQRVHAALIGDGDGGLIVPFWPGAYALLDVRAPVWEIYPTWPRTPEFERTEIARLQARRITYVIWSDAPMDRNDALRYSQTHPLLTAHITTAYEDVPALSTQNFRVLKVKATQP
jgi:hypothetical protein